MVIFLITMGQVIVLTSTFIENSQNSQGLTSRQTTTQNFALDILNTPGTDGIDLLWADTPTISLTAGWRFGLSNGNGAIDPFKMGRVADNSAVDYLLSYDEVKAATQIDRDFSISFESTVNVSINSIVAAGVDSLNVVGAVKSSGSGVSGASMWIFTYDSNARTINQIFSTTNETGYFDVTLLSAEGPDTLASSNFHLVSAITGFGVGNQAIDYELFFPSPSVVNPIGQSIVEGSGTGYSITISSDNTGGGAANVDHFALYGGFGQNFTQGGVPVNSGTTWDQTLAIPQTGLVGFFTFDSNGGDNLAFSSFPLIADGEHVSPLEPIDPFGQTFTVFDKIISVRGVLLKFSFTTWS
jgi:hypothetical protein